MKMEFLPRPGVFAASVVMAVSLAACGAGGDSGEEIADGDIDTNRTLNITLANHSWTTELQVIIDEFTDETGVPVDVNVLDDEQQAQLYNVRLNAGSDEIDVMMYRPLQDAQLFYRNDWLSDMTDLVSDDSDWDWDDFWPSAREAVTIEDQVVGVPIATGSAVMYYRKDLLEETGLPYPETMDDLRTVVEAIDERHPDIFAFAGRGERSAAVTQFSSFLYGFGADWVDADGNAAIASDEAKEAYELYGGLIRDYGPPGAADMNWPQVMGLLQQGLVAFYPEESSNYTSAVDPESSTVIDEIGVGPIPGGQAGAKPYSITAFALGISEFSTNKPAAWEFIKWATNYDNSLRIQAANVPGARTSVWENPDATESIAPDLLETIRAASEVGVGYDRPVVVNVAEARQIVGEPIVVAMQGGDVDAAADEAAARFQEILDNEAS